MSVCEWKEQAINHTELVRKKSVMGEIEGEKEKWGEENLQEHTPMRYL